MAKMCIYLPLFFESIAGWNFQQNYERKSTWKLSNNLDEILSSNCFIVSQGPSPTPTKTMDKGSSLQQIQQKGEIIY